MEKQRLKGFTLLSYFPDVVDEETNYSASGKASLEGAFSCTKTDNKSTTNIPADDNPNWDIINEWTDTTLTIVVRQMTLADLAVLQGAKSIGSTGLTESIYDEAPIVALNFAGLMSGKKYRCYVYYAAQLVSAQVNHRTVGAGNEPQDYTLEFRCKGRKSDGNIRHTEDVEDFAAARAYLETISA